jgi:multicomponent K+:H+ antiporter subunit F
MSPLLFGAIVFTLGCYVLAMALALLRLVLGPSAQDRVLAMDLICAPSACWC